MENLFTNKLVLTDFEEPPDAAAVLPSRPGVLAVQDASGQLILLTKATNLRMKARSLLSKPGERPRSRRLSLYSVAHKLLFSATGSKFQTSYTHYLLAKRLFPDRYRKMVDFALSPLVKLHLEDPFPYLSLAQSFRRDGFTCIGPFRDRAHAQSYIELLQDLFFLRRCNRRLKPNPRTIPCSYYEIRRCGSPCSAHLSQEEYQKIVQRAFLFIKDPELGNPLLLQDERDEEKGPWSSISEAHLHRSLAYKLSRVEPSSFQWIRPIEEFRLVIAHLTGSEEKLSLYGVAQGCITIHEEVSLSRPRQLETLLEELLYGVRTFPGTDASLPDTTSQHEELSLIAHHLYVGSNETVFSQVKPDTKSSELARALVERFSKKGQPKSAG